MSSWLPDLSSIFGQKKPQATAYSQPASPTTQVPQDSVPPVTQGGKGRRRAGKTKKGGRRKRSTRRR